MQISVARTSLSLLVAGLISSCSSTASIGFQVEDPASVRSIFLIVGLEATLELEGEALVEPAVRKTLDGFVQYLVLKDETGPGFKLEPPGSPRLGPGMSSSPEELSDELEGSLEFPRELGEKEKKGAVLLVERLDGSSWDKKSMSAKEVAEGADLEWIIRTGSIVSP